MNETLVIFDMDGVIIKQESGNFRVPVGIPSLKIQIPDGKYADRVDTSGAEPKVILIDLPKSEMKTMQEQINRLTLGYAEIIGGGI